MIDINKYRLKKILQTILIYFFLMILICVVFFPVFWMISISLRLNIEATIIPPTIFPKVFTLDNFKNQINDKGGFLVYFRNGIIVSGSVTLISLIVATLAGYSFSRFKFKGQRPILLFMLASQMFPAVLLVISIYVIYTRLNLLNTYLGLILAFTSFALPFSIWMIKGFCDSVPKEIEEAAYVDGCSKMATLIKIVLPMIKPGIIAVGLYSFLVAWNNLLFALTLAVKQDRWTIPPGFLQLYTGEFQYYWSEAFAGSVIVTVPLIIVFIVFQKYLVSGLTAGAVKE